MKGIMAVYDADPFYASRFAEFVNQKGAVPFEAVSFTSLARLKEFASQQKIDMLLVGDGVKEEALADIPAGQVVRLGEAGQTEGEEKKIYKYQASDNVLREVITCYQVKEQPVFFPDAGKRARIIGVYSPIGRCGKTSFALTMGQVLSKDGKALFLSLEEFSGFAGMTERPYENGLSELLYHYRQSEYTPLRLGSVVHSWGSLDYVPPVAYAEDLAQLGGETVAGLVEQIAAEGSYDAVVVDLGHFFWGAELVMALCDVIYTPVREDAVSDGKLKAWKEYLEASGRGRLWQRLKIVKLPNVRIAAGKENYPEQLLWGEMGDFVRSLTGITAKEGS